jgi:hypothetical protein
VWQLQAQAGQGGDDPVGEAQLMIWFGSGGAQPVATAALTQSGLLLHRPRVGQFGDELGQPPARDAGEDTMRQGRAGPS